MDFGEAMREQQARDQQHARAAAEIMKALRDLAQNCEQHQIPNSSSSTAR